MPDRLIQIVALLVLAGGIVGAFLLTPSINRERVDRKLTFDTEVGHNANAAYAFGEALGSFRGLAVNVLWQRAEELKQEGKFFEANNLAEMITTLQPRYPEAWNFHGWNMAYNISVKCKTAEERWDWVQKGMALIRDRGIPNNPDAVVLYRSLGWILGHKMAGGTDDMQWYYKERWVENWQTLLGVPDERWRFKAEFRGDNRPPGDEVDPMVHGEWLATERMRIIAGYADDYFLRPSRGEKDKDGKRDFNASNYFTALSPETLKRFYADQPQLPAVIAELEALTGPDGEELGLGLNVATLRAIGRVMLYQDAGYWIDNPAVISNETVGAEGVAIKKWLDDNRGRRVLVITPFMDIERVRQTVQVNQPDIEVVDLMPMLDLLRAQTLIADYHMDPAYMVHCMERFGPLDWRHPSTHAVYWTALGTLRAQQNVVHLERIDFINANRQTIHALQDLSHQGTIAFRPEVEALGLFGQSRIHYAADTRMIPAYEKVLLETKELAESKVFGDHDTSTYDKGHENFLQSAVVLYYFEGREDKAREYYEEVRKLYGNNSLGSADAAGGDYRLQMKDFIRVRFQEDDLAYIKTEYIDFWIRRALREFIVSRDVGKMMRYLDTGKATYDAHLADRQTSVRNDADVQGRQDLAPYGDLVLIQLLEIMRDPGYTLPQKSMVWRMARQLLPTLPSESPLTMIAYAQIVPFIQQQAQVEGWQGDLAAGFPEPEGYRAWIQQQQNDQRPRGPLR